MEAAIQTLVKVFLKSSKGRESLGKKEFQGLVKSQLSNILSDTDSKKAVDEMRQNLDANQDGKVGFEEYMKLVGYLAVSLSEQRNLANEEPDANAASEQVAQAQSAPAKGEEKPEAEAKATEEATAVADAKVEATAGPKVELKVDAKAEPAVDLKAGANASPKVEVTAEGATEHVTVGEVVAVVASGEEVTAEKVVTEAVKVVTTEEKVEEAVEEGEAAAKEVEKATEEATS